jgi:TIR domain/Nucleoside 2-deoxyribosyltransferase
MPSDTATCDVFVSHTAGDRELAREIASACRASGLQPFTGAEIGPGENIADAVWEALSESKAVIAILSRSGLTPSMAVELGGARAWNKPIFGVLTDPTVKPEFVSLGDLHLYTSARIDDVIRAIQSGGAEFSEGDREVLADIYSDTKVSVDQLALDPRHLEGLVKRFGRATGKVVTGERLLSELLRMRKQRKLLLKAGSHREKGHTRKD